MIERLKNSAEQTFGKKISCQKDCKLLSNSILEATGQYLSPATLRRIFGLLITNSNPSRVTLDILARYSGSQDWDCFINSNKENSKDQTHLIETWERVSEKSKKISIATFENIKRKSGINFKKTIHRQFAEERLTFFIKSDYTSTALIGPGGYGKSTLLANWYEKNASKKNWSNNIVLFFQAIALNSFANSDVFFEDWLTRQLGLSQDNNFFNELQNSKISSLGKIILIIDALDESNLQGTKLEKVYTSIANFSSKFATSGWLKIIISTRLYEWGNFRPFIDKQIKWFYTDTSHISAEGANMPLLTSAETQKILDNTINVKFARRTLLDEFSIELKQTLSYPYFLQLFIDIYHPENEYLLNDQIEIFREFLNKQVYNANFSEEKIDIINKILELSDWGLNPNDVKKNSLKEIYPIHLKLSGNYFTAYEDLISFGIILEEDIENRFGGHIKIVKISNQDLYVTLIAKSYIEKEEEISLSVFKTVAKKYANHELLPYLIIRLYQYAYKDRIVNPLKKFFELDHNTLNYVFRFPEIAITLRKDDYLRKILLPIYSKNPRVRKYLFEEFPDINNITNSFSVNLTYYLNNGSTPEEKLYANIYNVYAGFLALDEGRVKRFFSEIDKVNPSTDLDPRIIGKMFACKIMYCILLKQEDPKGVINQALKYLDKLRSNNDYKYGLFEIPFYNALIATNQHQTLTAISKADELSENKNSNHTSIELRIYKFYCSMITGKQINLKDILEIDLILSELNPLDSYIFQITGQLLKASYYMNCNEITMAYDSFRNATELSNLAGYRLVEVKLMKNLSRLLLQLGENKKSLECNNFAEGLTKKTGFDYNLL
jgi:hypothetical protein